MSDKRLEFTDKTKTAAFWAAGGCCQSCGIKLRDGMRKEYDHIKTAFHGGDNSVENCQVLCGACHDAKTRDMNSNASVMSMPKSRRMRRAMAGQSGRTKSRPIPGSRRSKWRKKVNGQTEFRE